MASTVCYPEGRNLLLALAGHHRLVTRMISQWIEIRIVLDPLPVAEARGNCALEESDRFVGFSTGGVDARDIVKHGCVAGADRQRLRAPVLRALDFAQTC